MHALTSNKTSQATPVYAILLFLSQVPGAPEVFRSDSGTLYHAKTRRRQDDGE
jgi:hypothetical protein